MSKLSDDNIQTTYASHDTDQEYGGTRRKSDSLAHCPDDIEYSLQPGTPRPWWMLGFEKGSSLGLFVFFGGAIIGYSLAKSPSMSFRLLLKRFVPGEGYWFEQTFWKINIMIHIFASVPASFFSVFCFLPITWKRWPRFHGILGYIVSILLVISCVGAGIAACAVILGCVEARRGALDTHREWMIRAWFYNGALITTNVTALISAHVITAINTYYSLWRCAECATSNALSNPNSVYIAVHASWREGQLGKGSAIRTSYGMALWIAMILHGVGIELYLRMTLRESKILQELSEKRANASEQTELQVFRKTTR
ncbi:hypothetical protein OPQ81_003164 [Rhizoctonia solani]|nr:hypothetical protein OPQ81_003164 [Rhizoctonia solani]